MGEVYSAVHERIGQPVALKILTKNEPRQTARFLQEARALSKIKHPHVVQVLFFGETEAGLPFMAMEEVSGQTLRRYMQDASPSVAPKNYLAIAAQMADGMAAVHTHHIVHRDLKPENILLCTGVDLDQAVKIIDFGIARVPPIVETRQDDTWIDSREDSAQILGTVAYMAPEQCVPNAPVEPACDVYALGLLLLEMAQGQPAFVGADPVSLWAARLAGPPSLTRISDPALSGLLSRMLARDPSARPTMSQVAQSLRALLRSADPPNPRSATAASRPQATIPLDGGQAKDPRDRRNAIATIACGVAGGALLAFPPWGRSLRGEAAPPLKKSGGPAIDGQRTGVSEDQMTPSGLLLITHMDLNVGSVTLDEQRATLPAEYRTLPLQRVSVPVTHAAENGDFAYAQRTLQTWFQQSLRPLLEQHPDHQVVYFGVAPIPLIVLLGSLLGPLRPVEVRLRHHSQRRFLPWVEAAPPLPPMPVQFHCGKDPQGREVVVRLSTSHPINEAAARRAVPDVRCEVDLRLVGASEDVFTGAEQVAQVASTWKRTLDEITERFPRLQRVHLFASVQAGLALLLGTQLSRTMHPQIQTYQYQAGSYYPALLLNSSPSPIAARK